MFVTTIIRLDSNGVFENTESNSILNRTNLIHLLKEKGCTYSEEVTEISIWDRKTFEIHNNKHMWFCYVTRIS